MRHPKFVAQVTKPQVLVSAGQAHKVDLQSFRAVDRYFANTFRTLGFAPPSFEPLLVGGCSVSLRLYGAVHGRFLFLGKVEDAPGRLNAYWKTAAADGRVCIAAVLLALAGWPMKPFQTGAW
jgi:hypothetical protein